MAYPRITTFPPLNQLTIIPPEQEDIPFTLLVEWSHVRPPYPFEFLVAFNSADTTRHESQWTTTLLTKSTDSSPYVLNAEDSRRATYFGQLRWQDLLSQTSESSSSKHFVFTIKFRVDDRSPWQWVSVMDGSQPGELVLQSSQNKVLDNDTEVLKCLELTTDWNVTLGASHETQSSSTFLLESKTAIQRTADDALAALPLASIPSSVRHFSVVRLEPYWLGPRQGKGSFFHVGEDAITTSFLLSNGLVLTFIVPGWLDDVYQVLQNDNQGRIVVAATNDNDEEKYYSVVVSAGLTIEETMTSGMQQVRAIASKSHKITALEKATATVTSKIDLEDAARSVETWHDSLTFCTWNALGQNLTQSKIIDALEELKKNDIRVSTLLIDDNWQTLSPIVEKDPSDAFFRGWADMEANTSIAPNGLKDLITTIRTRHPGIRDIGVWHSLMCYWGGISPTGRIADTYPMAQYPTLLMGNTPSTITTVAPPALHEFYQDFYTRLRSAGITFVKTDTQHMPTMTQTASGRRDLISTYQSAWTCAHLAHFGGKAISCMSQTPQSLFHSLLQDSTPKIVFRNSDDFYPEVPASHPWHVWVNAHNAVFTRHLNVVPGWDMFQTDHEFSAYHAAARCVSGGPILVTDVPGKHDVALIEEMTARGPGGVVVALRTGAGVAVDLFGLYTEGNVLKVRADAGTGGGGVILALFNVAEREVRGLVDVKDFGLQGVHEVLVRGHRTGELFGPIELSPETASTGATSKLIHVRLEARGWDILTAQPVHRVKISSGPNIKVCVLGLLGKMSGAAAVSSSSVSVESDKLKVQIGLKAVGRLGVWFDGATAESKVEVFVQGSMVEEGYLKLAALPTHPNAGGGDGDIQDSQSKATAAGHTLKMPHVWEVDEEAYWKRKELWDEDCREVAVDMMIG